MALVQPPPNHVRGFSWPNDRTLRVTVKRTDGMLATLTYEWATAAEAQEKWRDAVKVSAEASTALREPGDKRRVRRIPTRFGTAFLWLNTGPPTWWKPRAAAQHRRNDGSVEFMFGWLRAVCGASWHPKEK